MKPQLKFNNPSEKSKFACHLNKFRQFEKKNQIKYSNYN